LIELDPYPVSDDSILTSINMLCSDDNRFPRGRACTVRNGNPAVLMQIKSGFETTAIASMVSKLEENMSLKLVRLELARTKDHPEGQPGHGYEIRMPLARDGRIDANKFKGNEQLCTVRHFRADGEDERGQLVRTRGNAWAISYKAGQEDDEAIVKLGAHVFRPGEYVAIVEHDRGEQVFRVASVSDVPTHA
jgi:hypothetical protein